MLRCFYTSTFKSSKLVRSSDDACLTTSPASEFWLRGTCVKSTWLNSQTSWFLNLRYFCILPQFTSYSSLICPITSLELLLRSMFLAPKAFPILSPNSMASYFVLLLGARNCSCTPYLRISYSKVLMTTPMLIFFELTNCLLGSSISFNRLGTFCRSTK